MEPESSVGIAGLLDAHLAHHLADDDLDMLIVDVNALLTVHLQNFLNEVVMNGVRAADTQDIVRGSARRRCSCVPLAMTSPSFTRRPVCGTE